jgi:hypothetical protein
MRTGKFWRGGWIRGEVQEMKGVKDQKKEFTTEFTENAAKGKSYASSLRIAEFTGDTAHHL